MHIVHATGESRPRVSTLCLFCPTVAIESGDLKGHLAFQSTTLEPACLVCACDGATVDVPCPRGSLCTGLVMRMTSTTKEKKLTRIPPVVASEAGTAQACNLRRIVSANCSLEKGHHCSSPPKVAEKWRDGGGDSPMHGSD